MGNSRRLIRSIDPQAVKKALSSILKSKKRSEISPELDKAISDEIAEGTPVITKSS